MSFTNRKITVSFDMQNGNFAGGGNKATLSGLRISAHITNAGGASMGQLQMAIFGMELSMMNQLSTVGKQINYISKNKVTVQAGDDINGMSTAFVGNISYAWVDAKSQPNVCFRVEAVAGGDLAVKASPPTSVQGAGDVATIMGQIAQANGLTFENNGVNVKIANPYLAGSVRNQILSLAQHAGIEHVIDKGTLAIWKPGQPRKGSTPLISPATGMVGYPAFNQAAVIVETIYNPTFQPGGKVTIKSDLTPACGDWTIFHLDHELESEIPHGKWFTILSASPIQGSDAP
jgi:hypothetical protein